METQSNSGKRGDPNPQYPESVLESEMFQLIVPGIPPELENPTLFYIHKGLLMFLSPELHNHVQNQMKEGRENRMVLHDVEVEVIRCFLKWAYTSSYVIPQQTAITHAKMYVFGDKFNISQLQELAYTNLKTCLAEYLSIVIKAEKSEFFNYQMKWMEDLIELIQYCCDNLLMREVKPKYPDTTILGDQLLDYLVLYTAQQWGRIQGCQSINFNEILFSDKFPREFAFALMKNLQNAYRPPLKPAKAQEDQFPERLVARHCEYFGCDLLGNLVCGICKRYDDWIGASSRSARIHERTRLRGRYNDRAEHYCLFCCAWNPLDDSALECPLCGTGDALTAIPSSRLIDLEPPDPTVEDDGTEIPREDLDIS